MKDRIRQIMEAQHMTQQVFASAIGTTPATLSGIFNDRTRPTINIIESIKKKFPDISLEWLMFGIGDILPPQEIKLLPQMMGFHPLKLVKSKSWILTQTVPLSLNLPILGLKWVIPHPLIIMVYEIHGQKLYVKR